MCGENSTPLGDGTALAGLGAVGVVSPLEEAEDVAGVDGVLGRAVAVEAAWLGETAICLPSSWKGTTVS